MDNGTGETMNESGVRHLRVEVQKNTPFSPLAGAFERARAQGLDRPGLIDNSGNLTPRLFLTEQLLQL